MMEYKELNIKIQIDDKLPNKALRSYLLQAINADSSEVLFTFDSSTDFYNRLEKLINEKTTD